MRTEETRGCVYREMRLPVHWSVTSSDVHFWRSWISCQSAVTSAETLSPLRLSDSDDSSWALHVLLRHTKHSLASVDDAKTLDTDSYQCGAAVFSCRYLLNTTQQLILRPSHRHRIHLCWQIDLVLFMLLKPVNLLFDNPDHDDEEDLFNILWRLIGFVFVCVLLYKHNIHTSSSLLLDIYLNMLQECSTNSVSQCNPGDIHRICKHHRKQFFSLILLAPTAGAPSVIQMCITSQR